MARATYGAIITDLKGSICGTTFQHNASGKIVRLRPFRKKYNTSKQISRNQLFYARLREWNALTYQIKFLWNSFASIHRFTDPFGAIKDLTGLQWYISINCNLELIDEAVISTPPAWLLPTTPPSATLNVYHSSITLTVSSPNPAGYDSIVVLLTPPVKNCSKKLNGKYRLCYIIPAGLWVPLNLTPYFETCFDLNWLSLAASGDFNIGCEIFCIDTVSGIASPVNRYISQLTANPTGIGFMIIEIDFIVSSSPRIGYMTIGTNFFIY